MKEYLLGFDIGTQSAKGVLIDLEGEIVAEMSVPYQILRPQASWAEHDPEKYYWQSFIDITKSLLDQSSIDPKQIRAIGVDALVPTMMAVDEDNKAIRNAMLFIDNRAVEELEWANERLPENISLEKVLPKILWFKKHEPKKYALTKYFTLPHSYVVAKLTDQVIIDIDTANVFGEIFDVKRQEWKKDLLSILDIDAAKFPLVGATNDIAGYTTDKAQAAGLPPGIPVIVGTGDSYASLVGHGVLHEGDMMIYLGTAGTQIMCKTELLDVLDSIHISNPGKTVEWKANMLACGQALEWMRTSIGQSCYTYDELNAAAAQIPIGSDQLLTLPHYMGIRTPVPDAKAKGSMFGLHLGHTVGHMYRSLLEGLSFGMKQGFDVIADEVKRVVVTGGGSNSEVWCQMLSDCLNQPVEVPAKGGAALGIAYIAGLAVGLFEDFKLLEHRWLGEVKIMTPNQGRHREYRRFYDLYIELEETVGPHYESLYRLAGPVKKMS